MKRWFVTAGILVALVGCRKPMKLVLTKDQRARIAENILKEAPKPMFPSGAVFGDHVQLIGVDIEPKEVRPGEQVKITYYWKCLKPVKGPWKIFVHLELPGGKRIVLDHQAIHELYPVENWKAGQIIRDVQEVTIDEKAKPGKAQLWTGLFNWDVYQTRGGGDRMPVKNPGKSTTDGQNRIRAAVFTILPPTKKGGAKKGETKPKKSQEGQKTPMFPAYRTEKQIVVDGMLDDEQWRLVRFEPLKGISGKADESTEVAITYDDKYFYIAFKVTDNDITSKYTKRDETLWEQDVVEVYLDPKADGKDYVELQVSPRNVVFDALFASHRNPPWEKAKSFDIEGLRTAVRVNGTLDNSKDKDQGWTVEIAVPWKALKGIDKVQAGLRLRTNFFRIDYDNGHITGAYAYAPVGGDFHNLDKAAITILGPKFSDLVKHTTIRLNKRRLPPISPAMMKIKVPIVPLKNKK